MSFNTFFPAAKAIHIPGRIFPVQILYTKEAQDDYIDSAINTVLQINDEGEEGGKIWCKNDLQCQCVSSS
jgi:HrpA-like RNA helicase